MSYRNISLVSLALLAALLTLSSGCSKKADKWVKGRPPVYPASGQVLFNGEPVADATVTFQPEDTAGKGGSAMTDSNGYFEATTFEPGDGLTQGVHNVAVRKVLMVDRNGNVVEVVREPGDVMEKSYLPDKYGKYDKSGLQVTITDGNNDLGAFDLRK
ncbi:carboxypeptidase regulatory-like domain-containing protein [Bremerella sp. JC770]|uniref:carboxypeptidase regulatory-like domain-containing protein n=1 Tax=Bremerella sp. JC770 TaxID=3232137 RepID=UPI00345AB9BC